MGFLVHGHPMPCSSFKAFKGTLILRESNFRSCIRAWPHFPTNTKGNVLFLGDPVFSEGHVLPMLSPLPGTPSRPSSSVKFILKSPVRDHLFHDGSPKQKNFLTVYLHRTLLFSQCTNPSSRAESTSWSSGWHLLPPQHCITVPCIWELFEKC